MNILALVVALAVTQPVADPVPSGYYEAMAPHLGVPAAPLDTADLAKLPTWLEVTTKDRVSKVTVQPAGYIQWELRYGPHGLTDKIATVGPAPWTHSRFSYDAKGHLQTKSVTGRGVADGDTKNAPLIMTYQTDAKGRIVERVSSGKSPSLKLRACESFPTHHLGAHAPR
jgi:hypothetical protein